MRTRKGTGGISSSKIWLAMVGGTSAPSLNAGALLPRLVDSDVLADELLYLRRAHTRMAIDVGKDVIDPVTKLSEGSPRSMHALGADPRVSKSPAGDRRGSDVVH